MKRGKLSGNYSAMMMLLSEKISLIYLVFHGMLCMLSSSCVLLWRSEKIFNNINLLVFSRIFFTAEGIISSEEDEGKIKLIKFACSYFVKRSKE